MFENPLFVWYLPFPILKVILHPWLLASFASVTRIYVGNLYNLLWTIHVLDTEGNKICWFNSFQGLQFFGIDFCWSLNSFLIIWRDAIPFNWWFPQNLGLKFSSSFFRHSLGNAANVEWIIASNERCLFICALVFEFFATACFIWFPSVPWNNWIRGVSKLFKCIFSGTSG